LFGIESDSGNWCLDFGDDADGGFQHVEYFGTLFFFAHLSDFKDIVIIFISD
jgi:hypothetical protein